jgi:CRISPR-associated protein Csb2
MVVQYDQPPTRLLFDLRASDNPTEFRSIDQTRVVDVATAVRDLAIRRLARGNPDRGAEFDHIIAGRGDRPPDASRRPRIVPIPTIGMPDASPAIRRVLVEVPWNCPIAVADLEWALSGEILNEFSSANATTADLDRARVLVPAEDEGMLDHYGLSDRARARSWITITPAALPHPRESSRTQVGRLSVETRLASSVAAAARHAGLPYRGIAVRVQREPFRKRGALASKFAAGRFPAGALHHVQITFPEPLGGPVLIGDGRWLGLGLMAPVRGDVPLEYVFEVRGGKWRLEDGVAIARAVRRAVMARAGASLPRGRRLSTFFSGHEPDGTAVRRQSHGHLFYFVSDADRDGYLDTVCVVAPEHCDRRADPSDIDDLTRLHEAMSGLVEVKAGRLGVLELARSSAQRCGLFAPAVVWESAMPYVPTRFPRTNADLQAALAEDVALECSRRGLRRPAVTIEQVLEGRGGAVRGRARLAFDIPVKGPIALGRGSHFGQGLFAPSHPRSVRAPARPVIAR